MKKLNPSPQLTAELKAAQLNRLETLIDRIQKNLLKEYMDMPYFHIENTRKRLTKLQTHKMNLHLTPTAC